jgi:hypothetical protein
MKLQWQQVSDKITVINIKVMETLVMETQSNDKYSDEITMIKYSDGLMEVRKWNERSTVEDT